jgi:hypothetical protein
MGKKLTVYMIDGTEYGSRLSEIEIGLVRRFIAQDLQ